MTVAELVEWINQNYPRLSPYLEVVNPSWEVDVYLDKKLRSCDLNMARLIRRDGGGWEYAGAREAIDPHYEYCYIVKCIARKNQKTDTFLNKMKLICEGFLKMIDWYESLPIEADRAQLIDLGMSRYFARSNSFFKKFPDTLMDLDVTLPGDYGRDYKGRILNHRGGCVEIHASTLDELLDKIMRGEE